MGFNFDDLAAYQTPRVARIKDWRLGLLWYGGCAIIIAYIVGGAILINMEYMNLQPPQGAVRVTAMSPRDNNSSFVNPTPEELDYCYVPDRDLVYGIGLDGKNFSSPTEPCLYFEQDLTVFPIGETSAISLTTRLTNSTIELGNCTAYEPDCPWLPTDEPMDQFISLVENFTVMVDHSFSAPAVNIKMVQSTDLNGVLVDQDGDVIMELKKGDADILPVQMFLEAAGFSSFDDESLATPGRSIRDDGIVLLVFIEYTNTYTYNTNKMKYKMYVQPQPTKFKVEQPIYTKKQDNILVWNRHGIKLIYIQSGLLGYFSFSVLLLTFISGVGMIAICSVVVDMLAVYLVPEKEIYYKYKYLESPEYKDLKGKQGEYEQIDGHHSQIDH